MTQEAIKPCPFCGGESVSEQRHNGLRWIVRCSERYENCAVNGRTHHCVTEAEAITAWNQRTPSPTMQPQGDIKPGTPLPWAYDRTVTTQDDRPCVVDQYRLIVAEMLDDGHSEAEMAANAAYIVHCANTYPTMQATIDELVEAGGATLALARVKWGNLDADANAVFERLDALIAKHKGAGQ